MIESKLTAYVGGTFDRLHQGHINIFKRLQYMDMEVIVAVNDDSFIEQYKPGLGIRSELERLDALNNCKYTDYVYPVAKEDQRKTIKLLKPNFIVVGTDWLRPEILEQLGIDEEFLWENKINLLIMPRTPGISSTELRKNERD